MAYQSPDGSHRHKCGSCRTVWEHEDSNAGSAEAHTCPGCGSEPEDTLVLNFLSMFGAQLPPGNWDRYYGPEPPDMVA